MTKTCITIIPTLRNFALTNLCIYIHILHQFPGLLLYIRYQYQAVTLTSGSEDIIREGNESKFMSCISFKGLEGLYCRYIVENGCFKSLLRAGSR